MNLFQYILLAIIQGATEPLPISSSGHMLLFRNLFNINMFNNINYEVICNFGSCIAIFILFRKDIYILIKNFIDFIFKKDSRKDTKKGFLYCIYVVISTLPVTISGLLFKDYMESKLSTVYFLGFAFLITALSLFVVRKINGNKKDFDITLTDAIIIGLFQAITILPGISRSGTVLVGCLLCKLNRETSLKYTFILYFPVSIGAMILSSKDIISQNNLSELIAPYSLGILISGIITYFSYIWLSKLVKKGKLEYFSIYCLLLALFIFIYFR